ncbi:hypothetical protein ACYZTR_14710 [Pseudomonas sp. Hz4]
MLFSDAVKLATVLLPEQAQLQGQLSVLGTASPSSLAMEKADLVKQRCYLTAQKDKILKRLSAAGIELAKPAPAT